MSVDTILVMIAAIGGLEGVKWIVTYLNNRRHINKEVEAKANGAEIDNLNDYAESWRLLYLEAKADNKDKESKIDKLYAEIKELRDSRAMHVHTGHLLRLENETLKIKKCEKRGCSERQPPSEY